VTGYIIIATGRSGVFTLQYWPETPRAGLLRRSAKRAIVFATYSRAWSAIDHSRVFAARHPEHWYSREFAQLQPLKIVRLEPQP